jgi:hypothetical protein
MLRSGLAPHPSIFRTDAAGMDFRYGQSYRLHARKQREQNSETV